MAIVKLEPGEKVVLWHPPRWVFYGLFLLIPLATIETLIMVAESPRVDDQDYAFFAVVVMFTNFILLCGLGLIVNLARITNRRIIQPRLRLWKKNQEIRLEAVENFHRQGWRIVVTGGDQSLSIFCPPFFAPRILAILEVPGQGI